MFGVGKLGGPGFYRFWWANCVELDSIGLGGKLCGTGLYKFGGGKLFGTVLYKFGVGQIAWNWTV
jgi:hypothetical protein